MLDDIDIRRVTLEEIKKNKKFIINLLEDNYKLNFPGLYNSYKFAVDSFNDMLNFSENNTAIIIAAFKDNIIVGFVWAYKRDFLDERKIHINHIVIDTEFRGNGIGTKLINAIEIICRDCDVKKIELITTLSNKKTIEFYNSNGFLPTRIYLEKELV